MEKLHDTTGIITNFTLIGSYLHNVNSSPLNWKQYRFVSEEMNQKSMIALVPPIGTKNPILGVLRGLYSFPAFWSRENWGESKKRARSMGKF